MQRYKDYKNEFELISSANPQTEPRRPDKELLKFFLNLLKSKKPLNYTEEIKGMIKWICSYGSEGYEEELSIIKEICERIDII